MISIAVMISCMSISFTIMAPISFSYYATPDEGQTFDPHPHPGGFTKLPECPVTSLVVVLGFHWQWGWGSKGSP